MNPVSLVHGEGMRRQGPQDQGVLRIAFEHPAGGVYFPVYFHRMGPLNIDAQAQRIMLSFSGQIDQFNTPSPEGGSTPQDLMPEQVLSTGTAGMPDWAERLNVSVNVTVSRSTGQWVVEDCWVTDDPSVANELKN